MKFVLLMLLVGALVGCARRSGGMAGAEMETGPREKVRGYYGPAGAHWHLGNAGFYPSGVRSRRVGDTTYFSDGGVLRRVGNTWYGSDGSTMVWKGDTLYHSNGRAFRRVGDAAVEVFPPRIREG